MSLASATFIAAINGERLDPAVSTSSNYIHFISIKDWRRCVECKENHGKIYSITECPDPKPPLHINCRCTITEMQSISAGTATIKGFDGADFALKYTNKLPDYYITIEDLKKLGWKRGKPVSKFATGKTLTAGIYHNHNKHLPQAAGRIWYEADINYTSFFRNSQRIVYSNDGLIFVTYDHYETFYEII